VEREREKEREREREREWRGGERAAISTERSIFSIRSSGVVLVIIAADADAVILLFVRSRSKLPKTLPTLSLSLHDDYALEDLFGGLLLSHFSSIEDDSFRKD
jgi:hypothetical protein